MMESNFDRQPQSSEEMSKQQEMGTVTNQQCQDCGENMGEPMYCSACEDFDELRAYCETCDIVHWRSWHFCPDVNVDVPEEYMRDVQE